MRHKVIRQTFCKFAAVGAALAAVVWLGACSGVNDADGGGPLEIHALTTPTVRGPIAGCRYPVRVDFFLENAGLEEATEIRAAVEIHEGDRLANRCDRFVGSLEAGAATQVQLPCVAIGPAGPATVVVLAYWKGGKATYRHEVAHF